MREPPIQDEPRDARRSWRTERVDPRREPEDASIARFVATPALDDEAVERGWSAIRARQRRRASGVLERARRRP